MPQSSTSSDDEAPESFSFSASKKTVKGETQAVQQFRAEENKKLKKRRRERDRAMKEQKEQARQRKEASENQANLSAAEDEVEDADEASSRSRLNLEARMERSMREANEESDDDRGADLRNDEESEEGLDLAERDRDAYEESVQLGPAGFDDGDADAEMVSEGEDEHNESENRPSSSKRSMGNTGSAERDYLPDHLFTAAFSQSALASSNRKPKAKSQIQQKAGAAKKRKRLTDRAKDILVGGRTIRTLPSHTQANSSNTLPKTLSPPAKTNQFLSRSLNLRGDSANAKLRGWERRSANLGVMKRLGPAAQFVRS